ncbi:MAG: putative surface protein with fasciclin (FAS1) repeats, partial [Planctomycetota bacterium]
MNNTLLTLGLSGLLLLTTQDRSNKGGTLLDLASGDGNFTTLVAALEAAGLSESLAGDGPLTVFAPTNDAFAALGDETLQELLTERGRPQLRSILLHHVVAGEVPSDELVKMDSVKTLAETSLDVKIALGRLTVGEAAIEAADLPASNGVLHVIDRVLLPPAKSSAQESLLALTIQRGVALFNSGDYAGCCAVYATALDGLRLGRGFGLTA